MTQSQGGKTLNLMAIGQAGRLECQALLLAASLQQNCPDIARALVICEPQPGPLWPDDPRMSPEIRAKLQELGARIQPFESRHFGSTYPYGNKIEALTSLPADPFLFLDTDTLITGDLSRLRLDLTRPSASMRREGTWPKVELYGPEEEEIWASLYATFDLDLQSSVDPRQPVNHWQRYLYFNAGWFFGADAQAFGRRYLHYALTIRDTPPPEVALQSFDPWLDQIALPLVIHSFGGGRPDEGASGLDSDLTCHWRNLALLYARESDAVVGLLEDLCKRDDLRPLLERDPQIRRYVFEGQGKEARALFDRQNLPRKEQPIRHKLRRAGLWP